MAFIAVEEENDTLFIIVKDNGVGFQKKNKEIEGVGIDQIKARILVMEGIFNIETSRSKGTKITIKVPVAKKEKAIYV